MVGMKEGAVMLLPFPRPQARTPAPPGGQGPALQSEQAQPGLVFITRY